MGKVAVIPCRDGNHSEIIAADGQHDPFPTNSGLKGQEAHQMDGQKWDGVPVPVLRRTFPGFTYDRTVGVLGHSVHTDTTVPSA